MVKNQVDETKLQQLRNISKELHIQSDIQLLNIVEQMESIFLGEDDFCSFFELFLNLRIS